MDCDRGYKLDTASDVTCTETGLWSTGHVACSKITCNEMNEINHGSISYQNMSSTETITWSTLATFTCSPGFQLHGAETSTCLEDGTWSAASPKCQRVWCPPVESPQHTLMMGVGRQYNDVVRFACQPGYRMFGQQELFCTHSGNWNYPPPTCHSKYFNF